MAAKSPAIVISLIADATGVKKGMQEADQAAGGLELSVGKLGSALGKLGAAVGIGAIGKSFSDFVGEAQASTGKLQAQLGLTKQEAQDLGNIGAQVFKRGLGESLTEVNQILGQVHQSLGLQGEDLQNTTADIIKITDAYGELGAEPLKITNNVKTMVASFPGLTEAQSLDLITQGYRELGPLAEDLPDTLQEYAPLFSDIGLSATDMFGILKAGADSGIRNTDVLADGIKEMGIRLQSAGDTGQQAVEKMFPADEAKRLIDDFSRGGEAGRNAFFTILQQVQSTTDEQEKYNLMVELFGTKAEDMGGSMDTLLPKMIEVKDGTQEVSDSTAALDAQYDNTNSKIEQFKRTIETSLLGPLQRVAPVAQPAIDGLGSFGTAALGISALGVPVGGSIKKIGSSLLGLAVGPQAPFILAGIAAAALVVLIVTHWDQVKTKTQEIWNAVSQFLSQKWDDIKRFASEKWTALRDGVTQKTQELRDGVVQRVTDLRDAVTTRWEETKTWAHQKWDDLKSGVVTRAQNTRDAVVGAIQNARDRLGETWESVKTKASDSWTWIKTTFDNKKQDILNVLKWPFEQFRDTIGNILRAAVNIGIDVLNGDIRAFNRLVGGIRSGVNWVAGQLGLGDIIGPFSIPEIPRFARGGVHQGGLMIAGEEGEELLVAPRGTRVFSHRDTVDLFKTLNDRTPEGVPLGPNGPLGLGAGPFDGLVSGVKSLVGSAADAVRSVVAKGSDWLVSQALGGLGLDFGSGSLGQLGGGILTKLADVATTAIRELFNAVKSALPGTDAPAGYPGGNAILDMAFRTPGAYMWCEKFVGDVYQRLGLHYTRAASAAQHARMQPLSPGTGPAGAVVFLPWDTYGHVAFSLGDGRIYGTANTPSGKGVMSAWGGAGWTVNPAANGLHATGGPVLSLLNEANPAEGEIASPVPMLRRIVSEEAGGDVIEGGMSAALNELYKPLGKAGQAFADVIDTGISTNKALDSLMDLNKEGAVQVQGSIVTLAESNTTNLLAAKQAIDTGAAGTAAGLSQVDSSVLGVGGAVDGVGDSVDAMASDNRTVFQQIVDILRAAVTGSAPWHVITAGGLGPGGPATDVNGGNVVGGGLTPGMGNFVNPPPPGSPQNPIELTPVNQDVVTGNLTPGMTNLLSDKTTVNGDIIVGPGPVGGTTINEDVILGPVPKFAGGGVFDRPVLGWIGEGRDREIASPEPLLRQIVREETRLGAGITVNINGDIHVNSRADIDRFGNDVAVSIRAALRRQGRA